MPVKKPAKKRSKTYTGCWTCRDRSIKCGEEKPHCLRCKQSGLQCDGYGVGLVWPGETGGRIRRRHMLEPAMANQPVLSDSHLDSALTRIDSSGPSCCLQVDHFSVFPSGSDASASKNTGTWPANVLSSDDASEDRRESDDRTNDGQDGASDGLVTPGNALMLLRRADSGTTTRWDDLWRLTTEHVPRPLDPFYIASERERHLMHHWSSFLSGMMTPFPRPDNAFKDIVTPLALTAVNVNRDSEGHLALLHALYTLTAFSRSHLTGPEERLNRENAHRHMARSVHHLGRSFNATNTEEQQAILSAIIVLAVIPIFAGGAPVWRTHLRGGTMFLNSIDLSAWRQSRSGQILYQIFFFLTSFRPLQAPLAKGTGPLQSLLENTHISSPCSQSPRAGSRGWYLDTILGIPEHVMAIIDRINRFLYADVEPTDAELHDLKAEIYRSDPTHMQVDAPDKLCDEMLRAHAMAFYYATHIYFSSALLKAPPQRVQHFVRQSIEHLEGIERTERTLNVSGIMWPAFIVACETEGQELRSRISKYFDWREELGLENSMEAWKVVQEVWRRRDECRSDKPVLWHEVMADLDIDIMLT